MMAAWNLYAEMEALHREVNDLFRRSGGADLFGPTVVQKPEIDRYPRISRREDADNLYVEALIPGVDSQHLDMTVGRGALTLAGERKAGTGEEPVTGWHRRERRAGRFSRTIDIPLDIDHEKVSAEYRDGVLRVTLPKAASAKPKRIEIQAG